MAITLSQLKTENQVLADIRSMMVTALTAIGANGYSVLQYNQPLIKAQQDKSLMFMTVSVTRQGWQGSDNRVVEDGLIKKLIHREKFRTNRRMQFDVVQKRKTNETVNTISAPDIVRRLVSYFEGDDGIHLLVTNGYQKLRIQNIRYDYFINESNLYQVNPGFDIVFVYDEEYEKEAQEATVDGEIIVCE